MGYDEKKDFWERNVMTMDLTQAKAALQAERTALGIELGSTRIKAVLIGPDHSPLASGAYDWENKLEDGVWTYHLEDVWTGIQTAVAQLREEVQRRYGVPLTGAGAMGVSAMMHGYLPFDREGRQLCGFRTWRNTFTQGAAAELAELGWYFGVDGPVTYKNAKRAPEVAAVLPLDRILVETDAPYLTPEPFRGKRNDSRYLPYVIEKMAEWKGVTPEALTAITFENGKRFFGLE